MPVEAGRKLQSHCNVQDRLQLQFSLKAFSLKHGVKMTKLMDAIGMPHANMNNWATLNKGSVPFAVAKALMITYEREGIPLWLSEIQGKVEPRKHQPLRVTVRCDEIARSFDAQHVGTKIKLTDGSILTIASAAADALKLQTARETEERAKQEAEAQARRAEEDRLALNAQLEAERQRAVESVSVQSYRIPTPQGEVEVRVPALIPPGEREIYAALMLRLNYRNGELERELQSANLRIIGLQGQIDNMKERMHQMQTERGEERKLMEHVSAKDAGTLASIATPRRATLDDVRVAKDTVKVPALQQMIDDMARSSNFLKGAAHIS